MLRRPGQLYVDANAVSPATVTGIAELHRRRARRRRSDHRAARVGAGPHGRCGWPGPAAPAVAALFEGSPFAAKVLAGPVGSASALKACFAFQSKALPTLWLQLDAAARAYGVSDEIREELAPHRRRPRRQARGHRRAGQGQGVALGGGDAGGGRRRSPRWGCPTASPGRRPRPTSGWRRPTRPTARTRGACADRPSARAGPGLPAPVAALDEERRRGLVRVEPGQHGYSRQPRHDHGRHHGGDDGDQRGRAGRRLGDSGAMHADQLGGPRRRGRG